MSNTPSFVAGLLSRSLGNKRAETLVVEASEALALGTESWASWDVMAILDWIGAKGGLVGVAAAFAKQRVLLTDPTPAPNVSMRPASSLRPAGSLRPARSMRSARSIAPPPAPKKGDSFMTSKRSLSQRELTTMLANAVGNAASEKAVSRAVSDLNITDTHIEWDDLFRVLDTIAGYGGTAAASARFIKTRMLLKG